MLAVVKDKLVKYGGAMFIIHLILDKSRDKDMSPHNQYTYSKNTLLKFFCVIWFLFLQRPRVLLEGLGRWARPPLSLLQE